MNIERKKKNVACFQDVGDNCVVFESNNRIYMKIPEVIPQARGQDKANAVCLEELYGIFYYFSPKDKVKLVDNNLVIGD